VHELEIKGPKSGGENSHRIRRFQECEQKSKVLGVCMDSHL